MLFPQAKRIHSRVLYALSAGSNALWMERTKSEYATLTAVSLRVCTIGFKAATGISHSVDVEAASLYEAAAMGLARLKQDGWIEGLGPSTKLEITVRDPGSHHTLSVHQLQRWIESANATPADALKKAKLKRLLAGAR
jgi:hypothetical protein